MVCAMLGIPVKTKKQKAAEAAAAAAEAQKIVEEKASAESKQVKAE